MRETFQDRERDVATFQGIADLFMSSDRAGEADGIVCAVAINAVANLLRKRGATANSERNGQARFVCEWEQQAPLGVTEIFQVFALSTIAWVPVESERVQQQTQ